MIFYSREHGRGTAYIFSLTVCVFGVNVVYSCYTALLPDFVPRWDDSPRVLFQSFWVKGVW